MIALLEAVRLPKLPKQPMLSRSRKPSQLSQLPPPPKYTPTADPILQPQPQLLPTPESPVQIIDNRYIDHDKLIEYCKQRFGLGKYELRYKSKKYYLKVPIHLDDDILQKCEIYTTPSISVNS
ncbi:hypothetical protein CC80DRAFT_292757 [Byssothecium circinans]|uniref:Uncharacterized protein n=1 Tax=Byssothecium circinans TaxID=147558 RepID=A0A6A5UH09_9PLEO|nr:hypothetical protein CC80DRAFT_292757 [Byssothecium circinans]